MLNNHIIVEGDFRERYMLGKSWHFNVGAAPEAKSFFFNYDGAERFVKRLKLSHDDLWRLLNACDVSMRHGCSRHEQLAHILEQGKLVVYELPTVEQLAVWQGSTTIIAGRHRYYFAHPAIRLVTEERDWRRFRSMNEVEAFLANLALTQENIDDIAGVGANAYIWDSPDKRYNKLKQALLDGRLVVAQEPLSQQPRGKAEPAAEEGAAPAASKPVSLGPHQEPGYVPPAPVAQSAPEPVSSEPPRSLEECERRLEKARERLKAEGYQPKYTDEELLAMAEKGDLDDRYIVRFTETQFAGDDNYLGQRQGENGPVKYWSTTFNQLENADTDPETLCAVLGIPYSPQKQYALVVVDSQAANAGQSVSIVPTHKKLGEFANQEIEGLESEIVQQVMTPGYNAQYAEHIAGFMEDGGDIKRDKDINDYANQHLVSEQEKEQFKARARIQQELGANVHYTGDGTTKNLLPNSAQQCGVMETFTYDKNPQTLKTLEGSNSAKRIKVKPLGVKS